MHPLVYFAIAEFDRQEMLRNVERERQHRELRSLQELERLGLRVGHGQVARSRPSAWVRLVSALRSVSPARRVQPSAHGAQATVIGCRA